MTAPNPPPLKLINSPGISWKENDPEGKPEFILEKGQIYEHIDRYDHGATGHNTSLGVEVYREVFLVLSDPKPVTTRAAEVIYTLGFEFDLTFSDDDYVKDTYVNLIKGSWYVDVLILTNLSGEKVIDPSMKLLRTDLGYEDRMSDATKWHRNFYCKMREDGTFDEESDAIYI